MMDWPQEVGETLERTTVNRRYRVDRRIGEGGMAEVYLGHDLLLNRAVAVKAMHPRFANDAAVRARFQREAAAIAGLTHPNIVEVFDVGEVDGRPYLVMGFVPGDTLRTVIDAEGPFAPDDVAALLEQVGSALDFAHEHGIVHRDIKPQNVLVAPDGIVKVVDFGIAHDLFAHTMTDTGAEFGTVQYASPEQASGLPPTPSSDIYALGVIAFEMLTGQLPFSADSAIEIATRQVHERPPPPSVVFRYVPREADQIVLRALEKDPTRRYPTAGAFAAALTDWRLSAASPPPSWPLSPWPAPPNDPLDMPATVPANWPALRPAASSGLSARWATAEQASSASRTGSFGRQSTAFVRRDDIGWTTWLKGSLVLLLIVAVVFAGYRFAPGLTDRNGQGGLQASLGASNLGGGSGATERRPIDPVDPEPRGATESDAAGADSFAVPVPNLMGKSLSEARDLLSARGLLVDDRDPVFSESVPKNAVAEQDPPPNTLVTQGAIVVIKLSRGSAAIDLAAMRLVGMEASDAERQLVSVGLNVEIVLVGDEEMPAGDVVAVEPAFTASIGDSVLISVSAGDAVLVPAEIQGRPVDDVRRQLERAGLEVTSIGPIDRAAIEKAGVNPAEAGIDPGDVVGFSAEDDGAEFGDWLPRGAKITLFYYDPVTT